MFRTISVAALAMTLVSGTVWGQFRTVTVQNAPSNPVPTTVQGTVPVTGNVGITGTPAVQITGTLPAVQISGTPSVNVANTPNVAVTAPVGTAGPGNTTGILIKNLDNPARQPFQQHLQCSTTAGGAAQCQATLSVPAGKELVIEYLQVQSVESGSATVSYALQTMANAQAGTWFYGPGQRIFSNVPLGEHQVRIYADPGSTVTFSGTEDANAGSVQFTVALSGYLVNVP